MNRLAVLFFALTPLVFSQAHASLDSLTLPTYQEGLPDWNPPFDQFQAVSNLPYVYPYTMRTNFTNTKANQTWRALRLENESLRCIILPDLGGHIYGCTDRISGREMFYTNGSIKKQWVGLRGSWVATGMESNFPNGHSWVSVSPVDFAFHDNADGSASVVVGNVDLVTGMQWRCEFILRPGVGVLEQHVTLENRSNVRRRYYFWSNAGVRLLSGQDRFIVPTNVASVHGSGFIDTWPVGMSGQDFSVVGSYKEGTGYFAIGSHEEFLGVYQPGTKSGLLHVASPDTVPGKKTWTWGPDNWSNINLSDDNSTYVEIQGGATESQEVYYYLEPEQVRTFTEYWMPIRYVGGVSKANVFGVMNVSRNASGLLAELAVTRDLGNAKMQLWQNGAVLRESSGVNLSASRIATMTAPGLTDASPVTFRLSDATGAVLLEYTEGALNAAPSSDYTLGLKPVPSWLGNPMSDSDYLARADYNERLANYDYANYDLSTGLQLFPDSQALPSPYGRLLSVLGNPNAVTYLSPLAGDAETLYYGALARQDADALTALQGDAVYGVAASIRLAQMMARGGDSDGALTALRAGLQQSASAPIRGGATEVALLRSLGRWDEAAARVAYWAALDPTDVSLRYELYRLGQDDGGLWAHLGADAERVLNLADHLMGLGQYQEALDVLSWGYDGAVDPMRVEPGIPGPGTHPMVRYYRGYCKEKMGQSGADEYSTAASLSVRFIFPNRLAAIDVLNAALGSSPNDASALWLRGCLLLSTRRTDDAIADWARVRTLKPETPSLHRTLGRAWLDIKNNKAAAAPILLEGLKYEPDNSDLQNAYSRATR